MAIATGQFTIVDYNDALTLTGYINSSQPKTQQFNPDNGGYAPDWSATNLVLTPSLYRLGTATDIITNAAVTSVKWYDGAAPTVALANNTDYAISASSPYALTVKTNKLAGLPSKDYICEITYHDASTNLDLTYKTSISFSRVVNGGGIADAVAWAPNGNVFKNTSVASLKIHCDLWRGSVIDTTLVTYAWYQQDATVVTDQGGGVGWKKLSDVASMVTGTATNEITIFPGQVLVYAVFKCQIKDTDSASNTYNQYFYDTCTVADQSDPIQISIVSTGGDTFKNGVGSSTLTAKLYQAGAEIDSAGTGHTYTWNIFDQNGTLSTFNGGASTKTGKSITVGDLDVNVKATFQVTVS
jgi:hypothetical protein